MEKMRDLYRPDKKPVKIKFKKNLTVEEKREVYQGICRQARAYIHQITEGFLKNFQDKDRFQMAAKTGIINTMPQKYNEAFIKRIDRLCKMAESRGYTVQFAKWRTTAEYGWWCVRETL